MRRPGLAIAIAACGSPAKPTKPHHGDVPLETYQNDAGTADDPDTLPYVPIGENPNATDLPTRPQTTPATAPRRDTGGSTITAQRCIPAGLYTVKVDLSAAQLSQKNTGMADLTWCKSLLESVPATSMATMKITGDGGQMSVEWPPGQPMHLVAKGTCAFDITSLPMLSSITFADGKGSGTAGYTIGTQNHPDESCSAANAKLAIEPIR